MKTAKVEIRCEQETFEEWRRVCFDIDPDANYEDILKLFLDAYSSEPELFQLRHNDWNM